MTPAFDCHGCDICERCEAERAQAQAPLMVTDEAVDAVIARHAEECLCLDPRAAIRADLTAALPFLRTES